VSGLDSLDVEAGYDPLKLSEKVRELVTKRVDGVEERRYYRFRRDRWYGGIATGDVVGCNLRCGMCWSWRSASHVMIKGFYCSPTQAYRQLLNIVVKAGFRMVRLSGGEPTISREHLLELLRLFDNTELEFVLETNGLLIGYDPEYAREISKHKCVVVRVSLKGCSREEFYKITLADPRYFDMQLKALENLVEAGLEPCIRVYPAVMLSFSSSREYENLRSRLAEIDPMLEKCIDEEYVILYPHVKQLLEKRKLKPNIAYRPDGIPESMI